jgi:hypothetical protein
LEIRMKKLIVLLGVMAAVLTGCCGEKKDHHKETPPAAEAG